LGSSSHKQSITTALWRIATPVGAGAIHTIRFGEVVLQRRDVVTVLTERGRDRGIDDDRVGIEVLARDDGRRTGFRERGEGGD